jgi:hypothetical protein
MGRPAINIDLDEFRRLAVLQCTEEEVAAFFDVSVRTIRDRISKRREYREAWETGKAKGRVSLRRAQFNAALKGDRTMLIWLGKQMLAQKDSVVETSTTLQVKDARKSLEDEITEYLVSHGGSPDSAKDRPGEE